MPSSKLSGRRSTARKPSICISITLPLPPRELAAKVRIVWIQTEAPPTIIHVDQIVILTQNPESPNSWTWDDTSGKWDAATHCELTAPFDPDWNAIIFSAYDHYGTLHYSENYFQPSRPVPFTQIVQCVSYDYPNPVALRAEISPTSL